MASFIEEKEYLRIVNSMPIFCIDLLIKNKNKYLLIKRTQEPLKEKFWVVGGRLLYQETTDQCIKRILKREIGREFSNYKLVGFANLLFENKINSRASHTPTIIFEIEVKEIFVPILDETHSDFIWSKNLPEELKNMLINLNL